MGNSNPKPQKLKHYQIKAQKLLDDFIEKSLVKEKNAAVLPNNHLTENGDFGVRLFRNAPPGIVFDKTGQEHADVGLKTDETMMNFKDHQRNQGSFPGIGIDKKSKKFKKLFQSIAVDGEDMLAAAREANWKSVARLDARDAAAKAKAKREEERIAELRRVRGERWLPSIARQMQKYGVTKMDDLL